LVLTGNGPPDAPVTNVYILLCPCASGEELRKAILKCAAIPVMVGEAKTTGGEREVMRVLRSMLLKYQLHREQELFDRACHYIRQYC